MQFIFAILLIAYTAPCAFAQYRSNVGDKGFDARRMQDKSPSHLKSDDIFFADDSQDDRDDADDKDDRKDDDKDDHDDQAMEKDDPGSQFNAPDFVDTDFHKHTFQDLSPIREDAEPMADKAREEKEKEEKDRKKAEARHYERLRPKSAAIKPKNKYEKHAEKAHLDLHDWAPSPADRLHNGAFGLTEENGRPVPYRLSGHINIERGFPWEKKD